MSVHVLQKWSWLAETGLEEPREQLENSQQEHFVFGHEINSKPIAHVLGSLSSFSWEIPLPFLWNRIFARTQANAALPDAITAWGLHPTRLFDARRPSSFASVPHQPPGPSGWSRRRQGEFALPPSPARWAAARRAGRRPRLLREAPVSVSLEQARTTRPPQVKRAYTQKHTHTHTHTHTHIHTHTEFFKDQDTPTCLRILFREQFRGTQVWILTGNLCFAHHEMRCRRAAHPGDRKFAHKKRELSQNPAQKSGSSLVFLCRTNWAHNKTADVSRLAWLNKEAAWIAEISFGLYSSSGSFTSHRDSFLMDNTYTAQSPLKMESEEFNPLICICAKERCRSPMAYSSSSDGLPTCLQLLSGGNIGSQVGFACCTEARCKGECSCEVWLLVPGAVFQCQSASKCLCLAKRILWKRNTASFRLRFIHKIKALDHSLRNATWAKKDNVSWRWNYSLFGISSLVFALHDGLQGPVGSLQRLPVLLVQSAERAARDAPGEGEAQPAAARRLDGDQRREVALDARLLTHLPPGCLLHTAVHIEQLTIRISWRQMFAVFKNLFAIYDSERIVVSGKLTGRYLLWN